MDLGLQGKVAIVGGASMGIGYGIARTLAQEGARVAITARREPGLSRPPRRLRAETGAEVLPMAADCRRAEDCARVVEATLARSRRHRYPRQQRRRAAARRSHELRRRGLGQGGRAEPHVRRAHGARRDPAHAGARRRRHSQYRRHLGHPAHRRLRPVGRNLGRRDRLLPRRCRSRSRATTSTSTPSAPATSRRNGWRRCSRRAAQTRSHAPQARGRGADGPHRQVEDIAGIVALLVSPRGRYITGTAIQVDGGLLRARSLKGESAMDFTTMIKPALADALAQAKGSGPTRRSSTS